MSGNVSNHVWVTDTTNTRGGYWKRAEGDASGAAHVNTRKGTGETTKNRNRSALATTYAEATNTVTFTSTDNVTHVEYMIKSNAVEALQADDACLVIYDATNEAIASGFFADAGGMASDVMYRIVPYNTLIVEDFPSYLSRIDFLPLLTAARVTVEAQ